MKRIRAFLLSLVVLCSLFLGGCEGMSPSGAVSAATSYELDELPAYSGEAYVTVHNGDPFFEAEDMTTDSYERYSELDALGRCGTAWANVGIDLMPTEERGSIGQVKPTGWQTVKYDIVDGKYLYNRCHLIGFQLTGENANERNLITGTRYLNIEGMLPFEDQVADYVKETENHVLYRVTPVFQGDELVARGVLLEGLSVEDQGEGICFCVYAYNVQPGVAIDYATGNSWLEDEDVPPAESADVIEATSYVINTNSGKFHLPTCSSISEMSPDNRQDYVGDRQELLDQGYSPCGICKP